MLKRTKTFAKSCRARAAICFTVICGVTFGSVLAPSAALASDSVEALSLSRVHGRVRFQKRSTVVPMEARSPMYCTSSRCPQSSPYWALIVQDGRVNYEFHQPFAMGSPRAPDYVELGGAVLHAGVEVTVEGSIEAVSPNYGIISEVTSVSIISPQEAPTRENVWNEEMGVVWNGQTTGWSCQSVEGIGYNVGAAIWYGRRKIQEPESFHLRLVAKKTNDKLHLQGVAEIGNVQLIEQTGNILYHGAVDDTSAVLAIRRDLTQIRAYPATLKITTSQTAKIQVFPVAGAIRMICSPNMP